MFDDTGNALARTSSHHADHDSGMLPTNVRPTHYNLTLEPNLKTRTLTGSVEILLNVAEDSTTITLHSAGLSIEDSQVHCSGKKVSITHIDHDTDSETMSLVLSEVLPAGREATLMLEFAQELTEGSAGIYLARYRSGDGTEEYAMVSQLEPVDCRRAFPCFDEPALKATFATTMIADKTLTCLTNMDVKHVEDEGTDLKRWIFNTTPPMSTYILAFAAGKFEMIETDTFRVPVRVYATPNNDIANAQFALQLAVKTLQFFEGKLGLPYPLPKADMLGTPHFSGAMENWGLVIFEDRYIVLDEAKTEARMFEVAVGVIQHELAHQWFGNIVTMEWWDGLWLNESFATWAALYANDHFYPEWKIWQFNLTDEYSHAFKLDSLRSSHPVEMRVRRSSDINQIFDAISYAKGSCVLRMITRYIGEAAFLAGVRAYLKGHEYGNTKTDDLWDALSHASGKDVRRFGDAWTRQVGHPILTVTYDEASPSITIRQNRFLRTGDARPEDDLSLWPIPLGLRTASGLVGDDDTPSFDRREITLPRPTSPFFKLNADHANLYRTLYPPSHLDALLSARHALPPEDVFSLLDDAVALAASGHQPTTTLLRLVAGFADSSEYLVWKGIVEAMRAVSAAWMSEDAGTRDALRVWQRGIVGPKARAVGWDFAAAAATDGHVERRLKGLLFGAAVRVGDEAAVAAALRMWGDFRGGGGVRVEPDLAEAVCEAALRYGDDPEGSYAFLRGLRRRGGREGGVVARVALAGLGFARGEGLIRETLGYVLGGEVAGEAMDLPVGRMCEFGEGLGLAGVWMRENFGAIEAKLGVGMQMLGNVFQPVIGNIASGDALETVQRFFDGRKTEAYREQLEQAYDESRVKIGWVNRDREEVRDWLKAHGSR